MISHARHLQRFSHFHFFFNSSKNNFCARYQLNESLLMHKKNEFKLYEHTIYHASIYIPRVSVFHPLHEEFHFWLKEDDGVDIVDWRCSTLP